MSGGENHKIEKDECPSPFVSIHYIICECGETFPTENDLRLHLEKEHPHKKERKEYKCGICGSIYNTEDECIAHYETSHIQSDQPSNEEDSDQEFKDEGLVEEPCDDNIEGTHVNDIEGVTEDQLIFLIQNNNQQVASSRPAKSKFKKKAAITIVCEVCGKKYTSNAALKYHQRIHTGERPYQCSVCPKRFTMPLFLQIHVRTHTGERPYECPECPKRFSNKAALMRHERVHSGIKPYACPMCDKYFTQSNSMKLHVTTVHLKQPAPYKSKNRRLKAEQRSQTQPKIPPRTRKSPPVTTIDVLKNGLEDYVLGPLKNDVEALKTEFEHEEIKRECYEVVESEVMYDDEDRECYVVYE